MKKYNPTRAFSMLCMGIAVLLAARLAAQESPVRMLNGGSYLSEAALSSAAQRLLTELPDYTIRLSYVLNYVHPRDRYMVYDSTRVLPFGAIPNEGLTAMTAEELKTATNTAIHYALTSAPVGEAGIHIVYATVVGLDEQGQEVIRTRKYLHFGPAVSRLDKLKVKQIKPSPELEVLSEQSQNDRYLAAYIDELIAALKDPDYAINGTVRYRNELYLDGDTIFYFPKDAATITGPLPEREALELRLNARYPVSPAEWRVGSASLSLVEESSDRWLYLRLYPAHFQGIYALRAVYGNQTTTVYFYPVNLQIYLEAESLSALEPTDPVQEHVVYPYNNGQLFGVHPSLSIRTRVERESGGFIPAEALALPPLGADRLTFGIATLGLQPAQGRRYTLVMDLLNSAGQSVCTRRRPLQVKWPFDLKELLVTPTNTDGQWQTARRVSSLSGDTLYIVSSNNDLTRDIGFRLGWVGPAPSAADYWNYPAPNSNGPEPEFFFGANPTAPVLISPPPLAKRRQGPFGVGYDARFFPGTGIFSLDYGAPNIQYYQAGVRAFGEEHRVNLGFLRESREVGSIDIPFITQLFELIKQSVQKGVGRVVSGGSNNDLEVDGLTVNFSYGDTRFFEEDPESRFYKIARERTGTAYIKAKDQRIGFSLIKIPNPVFRLAAYLRFAGQFGATYEYAESRFFFEEDYTPKSESLEAFGGLSLDAGVDFSLNQTKHFSSVEANVDIFLSYPLEIKLKHEWYPETSGDPSPPQASREFNHGPAFANVNIVLRSSDQDYDWEIMNFTYSFALTDKVFNKCCFEWPNVVNCIKCR